MKFARDPSVGDIVTSEQFLARYGSVKKKERPAPQCPHDTCRAPLYVSDSKATQGFVAAGRAAMARQRNIGGFSHAPRQAHKDCPEYYPHDPRFEDLTRHAAIKEIIARNLKVLVEDREMWRRNRIVLNKLYAAALGREPTREDRRKLFDAAKKALTTEALGRYWHLYPYMIMALSGYHLHESKSGRRHVVAFVPHGRQEIVYADSVGTQRVEIVPRELQLSFVNKRGRRTTFKPFQNPVNQRPIHNFEISEMAWKAEAGVDPAASITVNDNAKTPGPAASARAAAVAATEHKPKVAVHRSERSKLDNPNQMQLFPKVV
jgi:hypothetical protein